MMFTNYEKMLEHSKNTKRDRNDVVSNDLLNRLVCAYFEYSLGRMTYVVSCCCDLIARNYDALTPAVRKFIVDEIDRLDTDEKIADTSVTRLGMDCDRDSWVALRDFLSNHMDDEHRSVRAIYADDTDFALAVASALRFDLCESSVGYSYVDANEYRKLVERNESVMMTQKWLCNMHRDLKDDFNDPNDAFKLLDAWIVSVIRECYGEEPLRWC